MLDNEVNKWILKNILFRNLPKKLFLSEKSGFSAPTGKWLVEDLNEISNDVFSKKSLLDIGFLNEGLVHNLFTSQLRSTRDSNKLLWNLFVFILWFRRWSRKK